MNTEEFNAEMVNSPVPYGNMLPQMPQDDDVFKRSNDLQILREYNREEYMPEHVKKELWSAVSKSIKLGFWEKADEQDLYMYLNMIKVGHIMKSPKQKYTFAERQNLNQISLLAYADFKRWVGMEKYKINERVLQSVMISQNIQGTNNAQKRGGVLASLKGIFG